MNQRVPEAGKRIVVNDPSWDATILAGVAVVRSTRSVI